MKTADLRDALLDYWVARAEGRDDVYIGLGGVCRIETEIEYPQEEYSPSTDWDIGGPLIEKYNVLVGRTAFEWAAEVRGSDRMLGDTPLQAICRAVVRAAFGDEVEEVGDV